MVFAAHQAEKVLSGLDITVGCITHPSPANPKANRGWARVIEKEMADLGIKIDGIVESAKFTTKNTKKHEGR